MTYPQYPPQQPQYPQQGYPPQQPQYPQQGYPPQQPQYPQQGYPPQQPPAGPPLPRPTLADFASQPSGGLKPLQFPDRAYGTRYAGIVFRPVDDGDLEIQRDKQGQPRRFRDGSYMKVLKLPLQMNPSAEYPDGQAAFYVKGGDQAELKRAMKEAGCPDELHGIPEAGAIVTVEYTHDRPVPGGFNPAKVKRITYDRSRVRQAAPPVPQDNGQQALRDTPPWTSQIAGPQGEATVAQMTSWQQSVQPSQGQPYGGPGPGAMVQGPDGSTVPAAPGGYPQQPYGQQGPAAQVTAATQAGTAAAQAAQQVPPPPQLSPENAARIKMLTGQPLTPEEQALIS